MRAYDFDIDPGDDRTGPVVRFRDPRTVAALQQAEAPVRAAFARAGFREVPSGRALSRGRFDPSEARKRRAVLDRLDSALMGLGPKVSRLDWGGFSIDSFYDAVVAARPAQPKGNDPLPATAPATSHLIPGPARPRPAARTSTANAPAAGFLRPLSRAAISLALLAQAAHAGLPLL